MIIQARRTAIDLSQRDYKCNRQSPSNGVPFKFLPLLLSDPSQLGGPIFFKTQSYSLNFVEWCDIHFFLS